MFTLHSLVEINGTKVLIVEFTKEYMMKNGPDEKGPFFWLDAKDLESVPIVDPGLYVSADAAAQGARSWFHFHPTNTHPALKVF